MSIRRKSVKQAAGLAATAGLAVVFPPAAVAVAAVGLLKGARKLARTGNPADAAGMVTNYGDLVKGNRSGR